MKYKILARIVRAFLLFGIIILSISIVQNIYGEIFSKKKYWQVGDAFLGDTTPGFPMYMGLEISVPDTIIKFEGSKPSSTIKRFNNSIFQNLEHYDPAEVTSKTIQKLVTIESKYPISVSNKIRLNDAVQINVDTEHLAYRIFWTVYAQFKKLSTIFILIFIFTLINIYLKGDFLNKRSFKLISYIGLLLVFVEVFEFIYVFINGTIIPNIHLETEGIRHEFLGNNVELSLNFGNSVSYSNIGIGIMVIILSKIIKDAVLIKQENDLTI
jgi:hypothetical protein